jgi:hypothetical protein
MNQSLKKMMPSSHFSFGDDTVDRVYIITNTLPSSSSTDTRTSIEDGKVDDIFELQIDAEGTTEFQITK